MNHQPTTLISTKKQLEKKYNGLSKVDFQQTINTIIAEFRNLPYDVAKHKQHLRPNEVKEFISVVGEK